MPTAILEHKIVDIELKALDTESAPFGGFEGYASVFGNKDAVGDIVVKGAYLDTLEQFKTDGFIALSHDWDALPIATITDAYEDNYGLYIKGEFHSHSAAQDARAFVQERLARGKSVKMSIGYLVNDFENTPEARLLKAITLFEVSLVTVPANNLAIVTGAKSLTQAGQPFASHSDTALAVVEDFVTRAIGLKELRFKEGRTLSSANREKLSTLKSELAKLTSVLDDLLAETNPAETEKEKSAPADYSMEAQNLLAEFEKLRATL